MMLQCITTILEKGNLAKLVLLIFLFLVSNSTIYSQEENEDVLYYEAMQTYYEDLVELDSNNLKNLLRAEVKLLSKRDQYGSLAPYNRAMSSACNNVCTPPDLANWQYVGPPVIEIGNVQWNGYVEEVCADPNMLNTTDPTLNCLMGTPTGGIWKYDGTQWINKTDILGEYGLGITEILRDPTNPSYLLASTGASHTGEYGNSLGVLASLDNGETWSPSNLPMYGFDPCHSFIQGVYPKYNQDGTPINLALNHFVIIRNHGQPDQLWEWCAPHWTPITPTEYLDIVTNSNPFLELHDLTTTGNTLNLTTSSPYSNQDAFIFHGTRTGGPCNAILWNENSSALPGYDANQNQRLELSDAKGDVIFARSKGNQNNTLYRSIDGGLTWTPRTTNILGNTKLDMEYSPATGLVYLGETYMKVWDDVNMTLHHASSSSQHADVRDFSIIGLNALGQEGVMVANDGGVSSVVYDPALAVPDINSAGVFTHQPVSGTSMPIQQVWGIGLTQSINPNLAIGNMHNNDLALVGGSWCKFGAGDGADIEVNQVDNSTVYYSINPYIYKKDFNNICGTIPYGTFIGRTNQWQFSYPMELHPANQCELYYGNNAGGSNPMAAELLVYNDCNSSSVIKTLTNVTGNVSGHYMTAIGAIGLSESNPNVIYLGSHNAKHPYNSGLFLKSTNGGADWIDLSNSPMTFGTTKAMNDWMGWANIGDIIVSPTDQNLVIITFQGTQAEFRVAVSFDGGASFSDYSPGLPELPANTIVYQKNTADRLFVGTDAGVYYRDNTMPQWECFSENLPLTWVTDLDINYCENMLYVSTHGRGVHKTSLNVFSPDERVLEISSNETWTGVERIIYSDITIKSGVTLNIVNATIKLAEDVRIIVEPSAYLEISGSELTSLCEGTCWYGIAIEGSSNDPQTVTYQGKASINGCTISNAKSAINALGINEATGELDWNQMGGIADVKNTTFLGVRRAGQFLGYENIDGSNPEQPNVSCFSDCNFIIDDDYVSSCGSNSPFITIHHNNGIQINGCSFSDLRTGLTNPTDYRGGIFGAESTFTVQSSTSRKCTFTNLSEGIRAENVQHDNIFEIQILDAEFYNNQTAIAFNDINNESEILRNNALIGHPTGVDSYGIVLHNSSGFQVEENICEKDINNFSGWTHGYDIAYTINSNNPVLFPHFGSSWVYNNISKSNSVGFKAWGDNVPFPGSSGLRFQCNQNIDNMNSDFWILAPIPTQGNISVSAGNTFTCNGVPPFYIDFTPSPNCFTYYQENVLPCVFDACIDAQVSSNPSGCNYITYVSISTAVEEVPSIIQAISLYPNPTTGNVTVKFESKQFSTSARIEIVNSQGQKVKSITLDQVRNGANEILIDVQDLPEGLFFILLQIENDTATSKFIKIEE